MPVVLILEDDPLLALDMAMTVEDAVVADVVVASTLTDARKVDPGTVDVAILDVNIGPLTSFEFARELLRTGVPFAFASGCQLSRLPADLTGVAFLSKPCSKSAVVNFLRAALKVRRVSS